MANTILPVQCQYTTLSGSGCAIGATSIVLTSFLDITGTELAMASFGQRGYGTLEPNNSTQEEQISFTGITQNANGTATLTGVKRVLFISPFTETSGVAKAHPGGSKFVISNTSGLYSNFANKLNTESITGLWTFDKDKIPAIDEDYDYSSGDELKLVTYSQLQSASYAGVVNMSLTAKGIGEEATQAEIDAGTQTGSTTAQLIVNPKYLKDSIYYTQLPSSDQKAALAGSFGTPSSTNKYLTIGAVTAMGAQAIDGTLGNIFTRTLAASETFTQSGFTAGRTFIVEVKQGTGESFTVTWFAGITWIRVGAAAPTQTTTSNGISTYGFRCTGTNTFNGYLVGTQ